jgi:hypothetical protein
LVSQVVSQPPQWLGSLAMSTHTPWHSPYPGSQVKAHAPSLHVALLPTGALQVLPQPPQFVALLCKSTQASSHFSSAPWHAKSQLEPAQSAKPPSGVGQRRPHWPQCSALTVVSMQAEEQSVRPDAHSSEHAPFEQTSPGGQAVSQSPQC